MRDILFRGKRIDNGEWIEGYYIKTKRHHCIITGCIDDGYVVYGHYANDIAMYVVDINTVGQYIGLTDKNGNKIFEGDIVDADNEWWDAAGPAGHSSNILSVEWCDFHCGFDPFADYDCDCGVYIEANNVNIIGNIYDNPELTEVRNE